MKKLAKILAIFFTMLVGLAVVFFQLCESLDQLLIAPAIALKLEQRDFVIVDQKYCSSAPSDPKAGYACKLFEANEIDDRKIKKIVADRHEFKTWLLQEDYDFVDSGDSNPLEKITLIAAKAYDAYSMEYSGEYRENWDYSFFDVIGNYRDFTARFATTIFTTLYSADQVILRDEEIIVVSATEKSLLVRRIYDRFEETYVFSL